MTDYPKDDAGNIRTDFVWGNVAPQPDELRTDQSISFGGGPGDYGWNTTYQYTSDTLDTTVTANIGTPSVTLDVPSNHTAIVEGYQNYPGYIPNYGGDGDAELEVVIPDVLRKTVAEATTLLEAVNLNLQNTSHTLEASYITSTGKTVRVSAVSDSYDYGPALSGLRVGDELHFSLDIGSGPTTVDFGTVKVTKVNEDGDNSWFEFKVGTAPDVAYDDAAVGTIYGGENLLNVITVQAAGGGGAVGTIHNEGYNVWTRTFTYWDN